MDIRNLMERPSIETMLILTLAMFFICIFGSMSLNAIPNYGIVLMLIFVFLIIFYLKITKQIILNHNFFFLNIIDYE